MAGWINSSGTGTGTGTSGGRGGRGFANRRHASSDIIHGSGSVSGAGGGRGRGERSRGRPPSQPHFRYRPVDRRSSPGSQQAAPSSTPARQAQINNPTPTTDKASSASAPRSSAKEPEDKSGRNAANFECNVCFDMAAEPVVTKCGHLFCWECLYQWLHVHSHHRECPVCKGQIADDAIIPIYGRGGSAPSVENAPPRPTGARVESSRQQQQHHHHHHHHHHHEQQQQLEPDFNFPLVYLDEEDDEDPFDFPGIVNYGSGAASLRNAVMRFIPSSVRDVVMEDQFDDHSIEEVYDYDLFNYPVFGTEPIDLFPSEAHVDFINNRNSSSGFGTAPGLYHHQEFSNPGANAHTNSRNRGRHGRRHRARSSAEQSSTDAMLTGGSVAVYPDNSAGSNGGAAGASSRPNGGWAERRRGRSRRNRRGMQDDSTRHGADYY